MLLKHLCIQKAESKRVIVGTLNTKTNSCVTLVPTEKACSSAQKTKMTPCFEKALSRGPVPGPETTGLRVRYRTPSHAYEDCLGVR